MTTLDFFNLIADQVSVQLQAGLGFLVPIGLGMAGIIGCTILAVAFSKGIAANLSFGQMIAHLFPVGWIVLMISGTLVYYDAPLPGVGVSVPEVFTATSSQLSRQITQQNVNVVISRIKMADAAREVPSWYDLRGSLTYVVITFLLVVCEAVAFLVIAYGLIVQALAVALGPLMIPFGLLPRFEFLFWGWFKFFAQMLLYRVIASLTILLVTNILIPAMDSYPGPQSVTQQIISFPIWFLFFMLIIPTILSVPINAKNVVSGLSGSHKLDGTIGAVVMRAIA